MKDEGININIESIVIENLTITTKSLGLLKGLDINTPKKKKSKQNRKKELDISEEISHNIVEDSDEDEIPYVPPRRIKAQRNFDE